VSPSPSQPKSTRSLRSTRPAKEADSRTTAWSDGTHRREGGRAESIRVHWTRGLPAAGGFLCPAEGPVVSAGAAGASVRTSGFPAATILDTSAASARTCPQRSVSTGRASATSSASCTTACTSRAAASRCSAGSSISRMRGCVSWRGGSWPSSGATPRNGCRTRRSCLPGAVAGG